MSAVYRVNEKKCVTCRWWQGTRGIEMRANVPFYVKVDGAGACRTLNNQAKTPATTCSRWSKWEKLP